LRGPDNGPVIVVNPLNSEGRQLSAAMHELSHIILRHETRNSKASRTRVVILNTKNAVLRVVTAYQGKVSASLVRVGELFRDAVRLDAAGVILVHNHPSGDPTPSPDDLHLTAEALAAGRLLDIDLLDHLVIGHDAYVSLRDRGVSFDRPGGRPPAAR
jgi:DNA repair protein RadC